MACVLVVWAAPLAAQTINPDLWGVHGTVYSLARSGNTLYLAGSLSSVGSNTGGGVPLDLESGAPRRPFARVCGRVDAIVPDGAGGWFIGGRFTAVEGEPRSNLAHVLADGSVADWAPDVVGVGHRVFGPNYGYRYPGVNAMVLADGVLYVGGLFTTVGGQARSNIAVLDAVSGAVRESAPEADGEVWCLAGKGREVFVGGDFTHVGGLVRGHLAALDTRTGETTAWDPGADRCVRAMAIEGRTLYVGGEFDHVGGLARNSVAAVDLRTGATTAWDAALLPGHYYIGHGDWVWSHVSAVAVQGNTVYVGGYFSEVGGVERLGLAGLDMRSGTPTGLDVKPAGGPVNALAVRGSALYVGGWFQVIGGLSRPHLGAVDARTGAAIGWDPRPNDYVTALALDGASLYVGGGFSSMHDWEPRRGAAAIDLTTGRASSWNPAIDGDVTSIGAIGDTIYLAGLFNNVNGVARHDIAAVDGHTGELLPWYPGALGPIGVWAGGYTMAIRERSVYVGGYFFGLGGQGPNYIAELDATTAEATAWNAHPDGACTVVLPTADAVYVGGGFRDIGGGRRPYLAAVDPVTAALLPWCPQPTGGIYGSQLFGLAEDGGTVYVSGSFDEMGGQPRRNLAAVDAVTGTVLPWAPDPDQIVESARPMGNTVWAGGYFGMIGGQPRPYLAALDATTGIPTSWQSGADGMASALLPSGDTLFVGGGFRSMQGFPHSGVAMITGATGDDGRPRARATATVARVVAWAEPNPARDETAVHFTVAEGGSVRLEVFDLLGRRVAAPLAGEWKSPREYRVQLRTAGWSPGVYLSRLEVAGALSTCKFVVVK